MRRPSSTIFCTGHWVPSELRFLVYALMFGTPASAGIVQAQTPHGSIVGWGSHVVGGVISGGLVAVAAGYAHSLGLKPDGSVVAWGSNVNGQTNVPTPRTRTYASQVAVSGVHSFAEMYL